MWLAISFHYIVIANPSIALRVNSVKRSHKLSFRTNVRNLIRLLRRGVYPEPTEGLLAMTVETVLL
jgi:hypothetical protein